MPFNAKKLRVALPDGEVVAADEPRMLPFAFDLMGEAEAVTECFAAAHAHVTHVCFSHSCMDEFSEPVMLMAVPADALPALREALEAQLAEVDRAEQALARHLAEG